ncbi:uncharacterized protein K02A2.6-like [Solenopsis invicta]|uniref:uncharacterized protein K02A2.6-like n=1 Tax=Solenopsis invicta TaxID=13686 RepID=UPI00193EB67F|nr:uncharacterized protein K02A2.6-like [Solenopsis invicta]
MTEVPPELLQALTNMLTSALQTSAANITAGTSTNLSGSTSTGQAKIPTFSMTEYRSSEDTTVEDYFKRFKWALQLSKIPDDLYSNYACVHMGTELNNALKFLICPRQPEDLTYEEIKTTLINHYDRAKNKYAESIKFRHIVQQKGETVANFVLRLKQGAAHCEYGTFLDRMLIEQMLHGLESREMCDEIIAKKPTTFTEAYEVANALEATRCTADEVKKTGSTATSEQTNKIGYTPNRTKQGHIAKVCRSKTVTQSTALVPTTATQVAEQPAEQVDRLHQLSKVCEVNAINPLSKLMLDVEIDGHIIQMELDSGAPCSIISKKALQSIKPKFTLQNTDRQFVSYTGHYIKCIGSIPVNVTMGSTTKKLNLYVIDGQLDTLFGREWISHFTKEINFTKLFSSKIHALTTASPQLSPNQKEQLDQLLYRYKDIFSDVGGTLKGPPATVHFKPNTAPVFTRAREVPLALRNAYAEAIEEKIAAGFYERVEHSEWASSTHIVAKKNGKLRITGNYKPTLNPRMIIDEHPIPKVEHLFSKMKNAKIFCRLDITDAYTHIPVDEKFRQALTLNTPTHGLIRPKRAVYGAANIPAIWQRRMEAVFQGIPNVLTFYDDILVLADSFDNLMSVLDTTLERLRAHCLRLNRSKCIFASSSVEFLGHRIDEQGIHKSDRHIEAIRDASKPSTPEELQLFLGKATYYNSFIPNLATRSRPLRDMLLSDPFTWTQSAKVAYEDIKQTLISPLVLIPYDPSLPLVLATDASKIGLGAVLSHKLSNGQERPIAYASRTLNSTEQRYPQIDKEALAIVWPTKLNTNADYCSRIPLPSTINTIHRLQTEDTKLSQEEGKIYDEFDEFVLCQIRQLPVRAEQIAKETCRDPHLGKIVKTLEAGQDLARAGYKAPEVNYTLTANCLLFEHRIVVPDTLQQSILNDLHAAHVGIVKMKGMARSFVYWPEIDADIERVAKSCAECAKDAHAPPKFRDHHWEYPKEPWERIHIDYAGPVEGVMLLIIVDAYSKWLEVKVTTSTTTTATIATLDELFSRYGVPVTVVSDNGRQFVSAEFEAFLQTSGVKYHKLTAPYHPSNGQAERYVQTVKNALKAMSTTQSSIQQNLNEFLRQ